MATENVVPLRHRTLLSINPLNGELMREIEQHSEAEIDKKLDLAADTFTTFPSLGFPGRAKLMLEAAEILEQEKHALGRLMTEEMGKTLVSAVQEAEKCAFGCRYFAENAARFLAQEEAASNASRTYIRYQPLGVVLAIMPWNFPLWQVFRFAAPALMAGNVALLKHASNVPQCALAIEDIFRRSGFPEGAFQTLLIDSGRVNALIADPRIAAVTLTGSVGAGSSVAEAAGKAIKKTVLELGGSDPFIVMPSADLNSAVETAIRARVINNGQSCIAAKRFIIDRRIAGSFEQKFVEQVKLLRLGDPLDPSTDVGPLATADAVRLLEEQVKTTVKMGARVLTGGRRADRKGNFYEPTVLSKIPPGSPAWDDEMFGPVASLFVADGMHEAIRIANDSKFGLGASAWTNDEAEREMFINDIQSGLAFVNSMVASDPRIPFGGVKQSGYGRELSQHGIREFVNVKSVAIYEVEENRSKTE